MKEAKRHDSSPGKFRYKRPARRDSLLAPVLEVETMMTIGTDFRKWRLAAAACVTLAMTCGSAGAAEVPLVDGALWMKSSLEVKKAYLVGLANVVQVEAAYHADNPSLAESGFSPRVARGMKGQTLNSVMETLDQWYAAHPEQMQRRWSRRSGSRWWCRCCPRARR
jgi:hypothetical protein